MWIYNILRFPARKGILKAPKQHEYAVEGRVYLDGKLIKQIPIVITAPGRRAAKFEAQKRITFSTGTVAKKVDLKKHG